MNRKIGVTTPSVAEQFQRDRKRIEEMSLETTALVATAREHLQKARVALLDAALKAPTIYRAFAPDLNRGPALHALADEVGELDWRALRLEKE